MDKLILKILCCCRMLPKIYFLIRKTKRACLAVITQGGEKEKGQNKG